MISFIKLKKGWSGNHVNILFMCLSFAIPLIVRIIPEILMGQFLVGFDTIGYYVPYTIIWLRNGVGFWTFLGTAPLIYLVLMGPTSFGFPIVIALKALSPLLLGFLGLTVYFYASKTLSWSSKKSLLVALISTLYFVSLRISWDMLRTEFGLIFLFAVMILLKKNDRSFRNSIFLSLVMLLVIFSDQLVALILFSIILASILSNHVTKQLVDVRRIIICSIPAVIMFFLIIYAGFISSQISFASGVLSQGTSGLSNIFGFNSIASSSVNTLGFILFSYLPLLPLLILSFKYSRSNLQIKTWFFFIFLAIVFSVIIPNSLSGASPYRWVLLLTYPLVFVAVDVFSKLKSRLFKSGILIILILLSSAFMVLPAEQPFRYFTLYPIYVPTSMLQNTLPLRDCQGAVNALQWVKTKMDGTSVLLVHEAFYGWASLTLNSNQFVFYGYNNPIPYAEKLVAGNLTCHVYLIWWINGPGWYGQSAVSSSFRQIYQSGEIAIYLYQPV